MTSPRVGLVAFGDGSLAWRKSASFMRDQAIASGFFERVAVENYRAIRKVEPEMFKNYFLDRKKPGLNFWKWKPILVNEYLKAWRSIVDCIVYLDAGCWIQASGPAKKYFSQYVDQALDQGVIAFSLGEDSLEHAYTKPEVLEFLKARDSVRLAPQIQANVILVRSSNPRVVVGDWAYLAKHEGWMFESSKSGVEDPHGPLVAHRHDQSVFSVLYKSAGLASRDSLEVETRPEIYESGPVGNYPFWAGRLRNKNLVPDTLSRWADKIAGKIP